jgi:hypothetical protein
MASKGFRPRSGSIAEYPDKGESMAEQIPEAWIGQEVTVYFGLEGYRQPGILESVSERGIVVQSGQVRITHTATSMASTPRWDRTIQANHRQTNA